MTVPAIARIPAARARQHGGSFALSAQIPNSPIS
jgi:hypothetical protein